MLLAIMEECVRGLEGNAATLYSIQGIKEPWTRTFRNWCTATTRKNTGNKIIKERVT